MGFELRVLSSFEFCAMNLNSWSFQISNLKSEILKGATIL